MNIIKFDLVNTQQSMSNDPHGDATVQSTQFAFPRHQNLYTVLAQAAMSHNVQVISPPVK